MIKSRVIIKQPQIVHKELEDHVLGYAYQKDFEIEIDPRQYSKEYLNTLIHEMLHCFLPDLSEKSIIKMSDIMTSEIWKKNYRRLSK
jgi:hypothetical protein